MNVLLLVANYLSDQRWPLVGMVAYACGMSVLFGVGDDTGRKSDLLFFLAQQGSFAALFGILIAGSALNSDLRTRRIQGVLSKRVHRAEYLSSLALGAWCMTLTYLAVIVAVCVFLPRMRLVLDHMAPAVLCSAAIGLVGVCAVICFSTIAHPFFATMLGGGVVLGPGAVLEALGIESTIVSPAYVLVVDLYTQKIPSAGTLAMVVVHAAAWLFAGCLIFNRRDIAIATE